MASTAAVEASVILQYEHPNRKGHMHNFCIKKTKWQTAHMMHRQNKPKAKKYKIAGLGYSCPQLSSCSSCLVHMSVIDKVITN